MRDDEVAEDPAPGRRFGQFTVLTELAGGGMGRIYLARSPGGRTVAVKTLLADGTSGTVAEADRRRFAREVALAQRVRGVYTASVVDADATAPMPWMATEYVAAPSLRDLVESCGTLDVAALHWVAAGIAEALVSVHRAGLVHRDVKPSNVLLPVEGPRVIDFGISQASDVTRTQATLGTVAFAAPEQARGEPTTPASDVFSLGATLFHLAVGRAPYRDGGAGPALEQLVRAATGDLDLSGLPPEAEALVLPCLALDPADRPTPAQILESCAARLGSRPEARGGQDWLDPTWLAAIERYRRRRDREVEEAGRRRTDPEAATGLLTRALRTSVLPALAPAGVRRRVGWISAALVMVAAVGLLVIRPWEGDGGTVGLPDAPVGFHQVESTQQGVCGGRPSPTLQPDAGRSYTADDRQECATVSPTGGMTVRKLDGVRVYMDTETGQGWVVEVTFSSADSALFSKLTGQVAGWTPPRNQIAIVQGDRLLASPAVLSRINSRTVTIATKLSESQARFLAGALGAR
ncbi:protein kinase [Streptomyces sp. NPDC051219]|uniref:serine/threonine-protein kinase n=1 Tax=Streptomyces sp. NPDC051219 TaxID=3155283 RepID=UPI00342B7144